MSAIYLLDTSVLSHLRPGRGEVPTPVIEWFRAREDRSYLSVVTLLEFERGVAKLLRQGHSAKARAVSSWVETLLSHYSDRIIDINANTARCAGRLEDRAVGQGFAPGLADALIGATALMHDGVVVTRNIRHFQQLGVDCADPFAMPV